MASKSPENCNFSEICLQSTADPCIVYDYGAFFVDGPAMGNEMIEMKLLMVTDISSVISLPALIGAYDANLPLAHSFFILCLVGRNFNFSHHLHIFVTDQVASKIDLKVHA